MRQAGRCDWQVRLARAPSWQALLGGSVRLLVRHLRTSDHPAVIILYVSPTSILGSAAMCALLPGGFVVPRTAAQWAPMLATGVCAYGNQLCMTHGLRYAKAATATVLTYLQLLWALIVGAVVSNETPGALDLAGAAIICGCTAILAICERKSAAKAGGVLQDTGTGHRDSHTGRDSDDTELLQLLPSDGSEVAGRQQGQDVMVQVQDAHGPLKGVKPT